MLQSHVNTNSSIRCIGGRKRESESYFKYISSKKYSYTHDLTYELGNFIDGFATKTEIKLTFYNNEWAVPKYM